MPADLSTIPVLWACSFILVIAILTNPLQHINVLGTPTFLNNPTKMPLVRIGHYPKGMFDKGLILNPCSSFKTDCYPDTNFAGLWTKDDKQ
jgi:hypothetical protein